ncbi:MAG: triose-phosphate isomerase [Candidatus Spechtbacterales bacterium]
MKETYIVGNWKLNPVTQHEAVTLARAVAREAAKRKLAEGVHIVLCPPLPYLAEVAKAASRLELGAQDVFYQEAGAYTGAVSAAMVADLGCQYVIVGHSERRRIFGDTNETVNKKLKAVLKSGMRPILAIGEERRDSFDERGTFTGELDPALKDQLVEALAGISAAKVSTMIIAYEPVWAIGTGHAAKPDDVLSVRIFIKKILRGLYSTSVANNVPVLYGGSTDSKNAGSFLQEADVNGLLVGGASLKAGEFAKMAEVASRLLAA